MMPKPTTRLGRIIEGVLYWSIATAAALGILLVLLNDVIKWISENVHFVPMMP